MLGPGNLTTHLADLGADVIKVEPPQGDYGRRMTWPIVEGVSLLFLHISRGKRSIVLDLRTDAGCEAFLELVRDADAVVEAMRPGGLERRGLGLRRSSARSTRASSFARSRATARPGRTATCRATGSRTTRGRASCNRRSTSRASRTCPNTCRSASTPVRCSVPSDSSPACSAARETGEGCQVEIAQSDAAAAVDWLRSETWRAYERPESEVTGNEADNFERRAPGTGGMEEGVRYHFYATRRRAHLVHGQSSACSGRTSAKASAVRSCSNGGPAPQYGDHARGNTELRAILRDVFATRTNEEWLAFGLEHNTPIAPANSPKTLYDDPQFQDRMELIPAAQSGADMLPTPIKFVDEELPLPTKAPTVGQHTDEILRDVLGWDDARHCRRARAEDAGLIACCDGRHSGACDP